MPTITIITPVLVGRSDHLQETQQSIDEARRALKNVQIEWIVVWDGNGSPDKDVSASADREVVLARPCGVSAARNAALAVSSGSYVSPLDADDLVVHDGLAVSLQALETDDTISWVGCNRTLLGGERTGHWQDEQRRWRSFELADHWSAPFYFHPNSIVARRDAVLKCGGWPGLHVNEDLLLALRLGEAAPGLTVPAVLTRYRAWEGQQVAGDWYPEQKKGAFRFISEVINAGRIGMDSLTVSPPAPGGAHGREAHDSRG